MPAFVLLDGLLELLLISQVDFSQYQFLIHILLMLQDLALLEVLLNKFKYHY